MTIRKFKEQLSPTVPTLFVRPNDPRCKPAPQEKGTGAHGMLKDRPCNGLCCGEQADFVQNFTSSRAKSGKTTLGFIKNVKMAS